MTAIVRIIMGVLLAAALTACGSRAQQPASFNLSGYSAVYKRAHADGCASTGWTKRRDERLYRDDADYMMGWNDGKSACERRK